MKQIILVTTLAFLLSISAFAQTETSSCPEISVSGGGVVMPGEPMTFSAQVGDEAKNLRLEYFWTVSGGTIIEGLGSTTIKVATKPKEDIDITATVKIKGLPVNCPNTVSETGSMIICRVSRLVDEFSKIPNGELKARIDALYLQIGNEPTSQGYLINYGTDREIVARENLLRKAILLRKYDIKRVTIVNGGANPNGAGVWTKIWIVPPGAEAPQP